MYSKNSENENCLTCAKYIKDKDNFRILYKQLGYPLPDDCHCMEAFECYKIAGGKRSYYTKKEVDCK